MIILAQGLPLRNVDALQHDVELHLSDIDTANPPITDSVPTSFSIISMPMQLAEDGVQGQLEDEIINCLPTHLCG